jgi:hypothetical protein
MTAPELLALRPLALGHDQEASACHWAQLTRRTAEYPSRRAQLALAFMAGGAPPTPDLVALLFRCDDCGRCRRHSSLPQPPDLARALWLARAQLVEQGAVPEVEALRARLDADGHLLGDLSGVWQWLGPGDPDAETLFVPDGAVLAWNPPAAQAALRAARCVAGPVGLLPAVPDSGHVLRELGLRAEAERALAAAHAHIAEGKFRRVLAGTPKEAVALTEMLAGLPLEVAYVGTALAQAVDQGRVRLHATGGAGRRIALQPPAALLEETPVYALITAWLRGWPGDCFYDEPDALRMVWPAAVERPTIGLDPALARRLAQYRLDQLGAWGPSLILTCDPYSWQALREVAPPGVEVMDLLVFAGLHLSEAEA